MNAVLFLPNPSEYRLALTSAGWLFYIHLVCLISTGLRSQMNKFFYNVVQCFILSANLPVRITSLPALARLKDKVSFTNGFCAANLGK